MTSKKVHVMVVDDSMVARSMIIRGLSAHPGIEVVGYAINTLDAKLKIPKLNPDVITMDVEMPGKSGIDFLKEYLPQHPIPVILVSSLNLKVFDALDAGAVDFVRKPASHTKGPDRIRRQGSIRSGRGGNFPNAALVPLLRPSWPSSSSGPGSDWFGSVYRWNGSDVGSYEAATGGHPRHGHCTAHAARLYQNVC